MSKLPKTSVPDTLGKQRLQAANPVANTPTATERTQRPPRPLAAPVQRNAPYKTPGVQRVVELAPHIITHIERPNRPDECVFVLGRYAKWGKLWHGFKFGSPFTDCGITIPADAHVKLGTRLNAETVCVNCLEGTDAPQVLKVRPSPSTFILAYRLQFAQAAARMLELPRYKYISDQWQLQGVAEETECLVVESPRHITTMAEREKMSILKEVARARRFVFREVTLP